jgi:arylsulfatase A-like enzyme
MPYHRFAGCCWLSFTCFVSCPVFNTNAARPNIVMILVDDLGYGDLSSYGARDLKSPQIDNLVSGGMRFDNFYANCPVCSPTRASLLTGRYPELVGVPGVIRTHSEDNWGFLDPQVTLLPQVLKDAGYDTAMVGKWHLGLREPNLPNQRGFDFFHGFLGDMMDDYYHHRRHEINYMRRNEEEIDPEGHATDLFTDWACAYLEARHGDAEPKPFFLYLAYNAPHTPIQPPPEWNGRVVAREAGIDPARARLVALIEHLDDGIGRVVKTLRETGLSANTLVIFSSDNGGQLSVGASNGALRDGKQSVYEGGLRVPTCAVWPGKIAAGSRSQQIALTMDLFPTVCAAAAAPWKQTIDGQSILPTLLGTEQPVLARDVFFHRREGNMRYGGLTIQALRRGDWKLVRNSPFAPLELYDLSTDPREQRDLSQEEPTRVRAMSAALRIHTQRGGAVPWQPPERRDVVPPRP